MGLLSGVGRALGGVVRTLAPTVIKALAPGATQLLKGIVGDGFGAANKLLNNLASNLPSPLRSLAKSLLASVMPKLQGMAESGIEKLIGQLAGAATERFAPGVGNVTLPPLENRAAAMAAANPQAATASTSEMPNLGNGPNLPPSFPSNPNDIGAMNKFNADMQAYQQRLSAMQNYWQMMSNILKSNSDTQRAMVANLR